MLSLGIVLFLAVVVVRIFRDVRIAWITPERIGHFAFDVAFRYAMEQETPGNVTTVHCLLPKGPVSNDFWLTMFKRNLKVRDWPRPICRVAQHMRTPPSWVIPPARLSHASRDTKGQLHRVQRQMEFTTAENERAHAWLSSLGWTRGEPFVCLLVRDSAFLETVPGIAGEVDVRYHDYRDANIDNFVPAAEWLGDQGAWVIRMGATMANPIPSSHPRVVDYAFRSDRNDFLDVWLFAHCALCISTGTGPDVISAVFRRQVAYLNYLPALRSICWADALTAPKSLVWRDSGRRLTLEETIAADFTRSADYADHGIAVVELGARDVLEIVQESWRRSEGQWVDEVDDVRRSAAARASFEAHPEYRRLHGYRHPSALLSSVWLRKLEEDLEAGSRRTDL